MTDIPPTYWYLKDANNYVMDAVGNVYRVKSRGLVRCNPKVNKDGRPKFRLWLNKSYHEMKGFESILKLQGDIYTGATLLNPPQIYKKEKLLLDRKYLDENDIAEQSYIDRFKIAHTVLNALHYAGGRVPSSMWAEVTA